MAASVSHFFFGPEAPLFSAALFTLAMPGPCEWWGRVYAAYIRVGGEGYPLCLFYFGGGTDLGALCAVCIRLVSGAVHVYCRLHLFILLSSFMYCAPWFFLSGRAARCAGLGYICVRCVGQL